MKYNSRGRLERGGGGGNLLCRETPDARAVHLHQYRVFKCLQQRRTSIVIFLRIRYERMQI